MADNNTNTNEEKIAEFRGKKYVAIPEKSPKCCEGCALINRGCYDNIRVQAICRQGFIFKRKED